VLLSKNNKFYNKNNSIGNGTYVSTLAENIINKNRNLYYLKQNYNLKENPKTYDTPF